MEIVPHIFEELREQPDEGEVARVRRGDRWRTWTVPEFERDMYRRQQVLRDLGVTSGDNVALISENRPEWHMYDFAILGLGARDVPIHANLSANQMAFVLDDCEAEYLVVSNETLLQKVEIGTEDWGNLRKIILMDPDQQEGNRGPVRSEKQRLQDVNADRETLRERWLASHSDLEEEDLATFIYTSGTTGQPKGVMLTHRNLVSNLKDCQKVVQFRQEDVGMSFLPLSHAFERIVDYAYLTYHSAIAYSNPDRIMDDLEEIQPTLMASVPRLFEKIRERVESVREEAGFFRRTLMNWALDVGYNAASRKHIEGKSVDAWSRLKQWVANTFVLRRIHKKMGGNLRRVISGGAALDEEVCRFFLSLSIPVLEGYGMTEMSPVVALNRPGSIRPGTVGPPLPEVDVKIAEDGEVLCRGPNMMKGYFKRPEATEESLRDGWFYTGDRGKMSEEGNLIIEGRARYTIITSWGENVVPQPLEQELRQSPFIEHAVLLGHNENFIAALIQPNFDHLNEWAEQNQIHESSTRDLLSRKEVRERFETAIDDVQGDWADYEKIKDFRLIPQRLTVKNGYLTPTMKVRRHKLREDFQELIDSIYRESES